MPGRRIGRPVAMALFLGACTPGGTAGVDGFEARAFRDASGDVLPYRLFRPAALDPGVATRYPLVIFLHGAGQRGTENRVQVTNARCWARPEIQADHPCFILAPQCPPDCRWVEVDWGSLAHDQPAGPSRPMRLLLDLIPALLREFPIDPGRIYLTGVSMGGYGAWDLLARRPDAFAAIIPVCGGADLATAPRVATVPAWLFHGDRDEVVRVSRSRDMVRALQAAGGSPRSSEYRGAGHAIWDRAYAEPTLPTWLFSQRRGP